MTKDGASVWTIDTGLSFAETLVDGIIRRYSSTALDLADVTILLPNRRAVRTVQTAFLRAFDAQATLLPKLSVLGEDRDDGLSFASDLSAAPIPEMERIAVLCTLIERWEARSGITLSKTPAHAVRLATSLARFLDQSITEGLDFSNLESLVPEDLAHHWQQVLTFLNIVTDFWPDILAARGQQDAARIRRERLEKQAQMWHETPPDAPVIAAGSTGSIPATAQLLNVISRLPQGHLILPGLNRTIPDEVWAEISESHPQGPLKRLLEQLEMTRGDVGDWTVTAVDETRTRRLAMIDAALRPSGDFHRAVHSFQHAGPLPGITLAETEGDHSEAGVIAVILKETLETPGKTAALITPDRTLARRVRAQMKRWGMEIDDSAGRPLADTPPAQFMRLVAQAVTSDWSPAALLSLMKHPFFTCGQERQAALAHARALDTSLRGPRRSGGLDALISSCKDDALEDLLQSLAQQVAPWPQTPQSFAEHLAQHIQLADVLAGDAIFAGQDGNALALWCDKARDADFPNVDLENYSALFDALMEAEVVRSAAPTHPRLSILGTIEARMATADVMVLGGLNEGVWPPSPEADPWMSEPMRTRFGLPPAERRVGLSAHDFVQACGAQQVVLTRTTKSGGAPTLASRWISRLKAAYGDKLVRADPQIAWAEALDAPARYAPMAQPCPKPPISMRPTRFSVSDIERLMRDPYAHYASKILHLKPLQMLDEPPGAADRGSAIHNALEAFFKAAQTGWPKDPYASLLKAGEAAFAQWSARPGVWALWWPRFEDVARWILDQQRTLTARGRKVAQIETKGAMTIQVGAREWTITAKADRLDLDARGVVVLDYKTGKPPDKHLLMKGYAPQLPIEGLIAQNNGFHLPTNTVADFEYWALSTTGTDGPKRHSGMEAEALMDAAREGLEKLLIAFSDPKVGYLPAPAPMYSPYKDYDDLAREEEWRDVPEAGQH